MSDALVSVSRDAALNAAQCLFFDYGDRMADAARFSRTSCGLMTSRVMMPYWSTRWR